MAVNVEMDIQDNLLTIRVNLSKEQGPSKSGKTIVIASTQGNIDVPGQPGVKLGLNVYKGR